MIPGGGIVDYASTVPPPNYRPKETANMARRRNTTAGNNGSTTTKHTGKVVAREAIVINVGARPIEYGRITVIDRHTNEPVEIDNHLDIVDEGDEGIPYAFKAFQKVDARHPAVEANPDAFIPLSDVEDDDRDRVTA